jgi:hypothetical protein
MGHSLSRKSWRERDPWSAPRSPARLCSSVRNQSRKMNDTTNVITIEPEPPLPDSHRELELLLDALQALNATLDEYLEAEATEKAD